jgi:hypothetical protein
MIKMIKMITNDIKEERQNLKKIEKDKNLQKFTKNQLSYLK